MIDYKYFLIGVLTFGYLADMLGEGLMSLGVFLGWLVGLMTVTQWQIEKDELKKGKKK